jgi:hypothetical protein
MGIKVKGISQAKKHLNDVINDVKGRKVIRAAVGDDSYRCPGGLLHPDRHLHAD